MGSVTDRSIGVPPRWWAWTLACGLAEVVGMMAAAGAFALSLVLVGEPGTWGAGGVVLLVVMVGGAIEGLAIGYAQWLLLHRWLVSLTSSAWIGVTVAAAVLGWFIGTMPSIAIAVVGTESASSAATTQATTQATTGPPLWAMSMVGFGSGLALGALFGWAQWFVLRHHVTNARVWVAANALGWAAAMAIMFTGAGVPGGPWPLVHLLPLAAVTGVLAGMAIGAVTGALLPRLRPIQHVVRLEPLEPHTLQVGEASD